MHVDAPNLVHAEILQNYSPWRVLNTRYFVQRLPVIRMSHMLNARENLQSRNKIENEQTRYMRWNEFQNPILWMSGTRLIHKVMSQKISEKKVYFWYSYHCPPDTAL